MAQTKHHKDILYRFTMWGWQVNEYSIIVILSLCCHLEWLLRRTKFYCSWKLKLRQACQTSVLKEKEHEARMKGFTVKDWGEKNKQRKCLFCTGFVLLTVMIIRSRRLLSFYGYSHHYPLPLSVMKMVELGIFLLNGIFRSCFHFLDL